MTKAGPSLGRAAMIRAADTARKLDPSSPASPAPR